ncbi:acyl-CoA thioesterase [Acinetobacter vivianii]|uniref:acyl-CoA thioesterase n=1 Tax=Acinetobacter vivianii TaxID=1776742 RepID=UPI002DB8B7A8|nr:thioesterase family protein [Acinetobacter vivianii]MEB6478628.1 acyl-CoA thioesterase [Acinetobacter vivianii]MEB6657541.1 acyl-CoA thioesterase [Acinetobacter vivianii]
MSKPILKTRAQFKFFFPIQTRWADNDIYGHVNNVTYYSYFDTAANSLLIQKTGFDIHNSEIIGLVVDSACSFLQELSFPEIVEVGVAIGKIGNSSLRYELAIFKQDQPQAAAQGHFVHVFVDREHRKSTAIPPAIREVLEQYLLPSE